MHQKTHCFPNCTVIYRIRKDGRKEGGLCMFIRKDLTLDIRNDLRKFDNNSIHRD